MMSPLAGAVISATGVAVGWAALGCSLSGFPGRRVRRRLGRAGGSWARVGEQVLARSSRWALWQRWEEHRRGRRRLDHLPELVGAIERSLSAGASLRQALETAGAVVGGVLEQELGLLARRVDAGVPFPDALRRWASESRSEEVGLLAVACELGAELGRGTAAALGGVAATLAHRRDVGAEAHAAAAQARASALLLSALPVAFAAGLALVDRRSFTTLVLTPVGWSCLLVAAVLDSLGMLWMRRQIRAAS